MRLRASFVIVTAALTAGFAACTLNPQPLPPSGLDNEAAGNSDASADSGSFTTTNPPSPVADAGGDDREGGNDADGGDGGDAGDASTDAPDGD